MQPDILGLLEDIHDAIGFIDEDAAGTTFETFMGDRRRRQAVERNFEIMGEAVNRLHRRPGHCRADQCLTTDRCVPERDHPRVRHDRVSARLADHSRIAAGVENRDRTDSPRG